MDGFEAIAKEMEDKVVQLKDYLATGRATTYEEYKMLCGEIKGLLFAKDYSLGLKRTVEESDD